MNSKGKITVLVASIGLSLVAVSAQAGNVGFSINYSDYDHRVERSYYSYAYPAYHTIQYNYYPYHGIKHYKKHHKHYDDSYRKHKHDWKCNHGYDLRSYNHHDVYDYRQKHRKHDRYEYD